MLKPKHACASPGCPQLTDARYCARHYQKRPSARAAGYTTEWDRDSKAFLERNPFCCDPFARHRGELIQATVTGHKRAFKGNEQLKSDISNWYPLCASCNAYQCVREEGGFGNAYKHNRPVG